MADALRELAAMKTEFKDMYDRLFDHEIDLEQSNVLDDHITEITVSYFRYYIFYYAHVLDLKTLFLRKISKVYVRFI